MRRCRRCAAVPLGIVGEPTPARGAGLELDLFEGQAWLGLAGAAMAHAPKVKTAGGVVVGEATEKADIFRNIPFAAAPELGSVRGLGAGHADCTRVCHITVRGGDPG